MAIRHSKLSAGQAARFAEIDRLKAVNAELIAALQELLAAGDYCVDSEDHVSSMMRFGNAHAVARAALTKAKEGAK